MSAVLKEVKRPPKTTIYRDVEVEFDISEFDDEDLLAELAKRNITPQVDAVSVEDLYLAMKFGDHAKALELLRQYLMNVTGRIIP